MTPLLQRVCHLPIALLASFAVGIDLVRVTPAQAQTVAEHAARSKQLADDDTWPAEAARLVRLGSEATPSLVVALRNSRQAEQWQVVRRILAILERLGPDAFDAAEAVGELLDGEDPATLVAAFDALRSMAPPSFDSLDDTFNALLQKIGDRVSDDQRRQVREHGQFAVVVVDARRRLRSLPRRGLKNVLATASSTLALPAFDLLVTEALPTADDRDEILLMLGKRFHSMVPDALDADRTPGARANELLLLRIADLLLRCDPTGEHAALARGYLMLRDRFPALRHDAARELVVMGADGLPALPALEAYLKHHRDDAELNRHVVSCAVAMGTAARPLLPLIRELAKSDDEKLRPLVEMAIRRLGEHGEDRKQGPD